MRRFTLATATLACVLAACSSQKEPAQRVIADAESALASSREDAARLAPELLASVDDGVSELRGHLADGDYDAVLAAAPDITAQIAALKDAIASSEAAEASATATVGAQPAVTGPSPP